MEIAKHIICLGVTVTALVYFWGLARTKKRKPTREEFYKRKFKPYECHECGRTVHYRPSYIEFKNKFCKICAMEHYN